MATTMRERPMPVKSTAPSMARGTETYGVRSSAALLTDWKSPAKHG